MPESPDVDLEAVKNKAIEIAQQKGAKGNVATEITPIAFGLKQLKVLGMFEGGEGLDSDAIADEMGKIEGVQSSEVLSADLALG